MLNRQYILRKLEEYLNDAREISAEEFELLFSGLNKQEQYEVIRIMIEEDVEYVDEKSTLEDVRSTTAKGEIVYSQNIEDYKHLRSSLLCKLYQAGNRVALDALVEKNRRYVGKIAERAYRNYPGVILEFEDLLHEGMLGLMEAAKRFHEGNDTTFLTYATFWIRQKITRAVIDTGYTIRLPVHVFEKVKRVTKYRGLYSLLTKEELTAKIMNEDPRFASSEEIENCLIYSDLYLSTASLNTLVGEDGDSELIDFIPDEKQLDPHTLTEQAQRTTTLKAVVRTLTPREDIIIALRYGLMAGRPHTLEEIGNRYGLTRERIRQIEVKALRKLRHPSRAKKLQDFYEE